MGVMSLARVTTAVTAALLAVVAAATPASASTAPDTWPQGESLSMLEVLGIFGGGTLLLFVVIWGLAAAFNAKLQHHVVASPANRDAVAVEGTPHHSELPATEDPAKH